MKSPKQITTPNSIQTSALLYEPTSVLDHHLTSSPAASTAITLFTQNPSSDDWDPLSFFDATESSNFINSLDLSDLNPPSPQQQPTTPFDKFHLDLLLKAAASIESNDLSTAHSILSRLTQTCSFDSTTSTTTTSILSPLLRVAFHFKDALLSLLPIPNPPTPTPPISPLEIVTRIAAHKSFSDLSPIPQFTSFTANQTLLEYLLLDHRSPQAVHVIDFDIGLGGQWSSFAQEISSRSKSLRLPPPRIRITAVVQDETVETVLAAENLRDFARAVGVNLTVAFVHVSTLGTLALGRVRVLSGEAVGVVLTPNVFRLVGGTPESTAALLRFVRQVSPRIVVFVDTECYGVSRSFRRSFATGLEFYSTVLESVYAAAAGGGGEEEEEVVGEVVRRVERAVIRPRVFGAVAGWVPRDATWQEVLGREGFGMVGFSEFTESQAEWLIRMGPVEGFQVARREGTMVLSWRGREIAATSAWMC